jgi:hypothetical protein
MILTQHCNHVRFKFGLCFTKIATKHHILILKLLLSPLHLVGFLQIVLEKKTQNLYFLFRPVLNRGHCSYGWELRGF